MFLSEFQMDAPEKEKLVLKRSILGLGKKIFVMRNDYLNRKKKKKKRKKKDVRY